jgi:hypothetical protein
MASPAQVLANRENAQHSTGPRTEEGKSRTRLNGLRHGLTGQNVLLPEEDRQVYEAHCAAFLEEFAPEGPLETQLAQTIADDFWRLNRIKAVEDNIFALGIEAHAENPADETEAALAQAQTFLEDARQFNLLSLYEQRLNRSVHKKLAELRELQRLRKVAQAAQPPKNGSAFSSGKIKQPQTTKIPGDVLKMNQKLCEDPLQRPAA